jgi:putative membrane protein
MNTQNPTEQKYTKWIWILSIVIPVAVAALFGVNLKDLGFNVEPLTFFTSNLRYN